MNIDLDTHNHTFTEEELNSPDIGYTIADLIWEAHKVGKVCMINGKPYMKPDTRSVMEKMVDVDREWEQRHNVMA